MRDLKSTPLISNPPTALLFAKVPHYPAAITSAAACGGRALALVLLPGGFAKVFPSL